MFASNPQAPGTHEEVESRYRDLLASHQQQHNSIAAGRTVFMRLLAACALILAFLTSKSLHGGGPAWPFVLVFAAIAVLLWLVMRRQNKLTRLQRLLTFYDNAIHRVDPQPQSDRIGTDPAQDAGQNLHPASHLYERDLDLLGTFPGQASLFALLSTVRTGPGERGLARYLLEPATHAESLERQSAVKELLPQTELREQIALLGASSFHQISASFFDEWLDDTPPTFHPAFRIALCITAALNVALLAAGIMHLRSWPDVLPNLFAVLAVQGALCYFLRKRVLPLLQGGARLELNVRLLADGLALMQRSSFTCPKLQALQQAALTPAEAPKLLKSLTSSLAIVEQRTKEYFLLFSLFLAAGTQAAISIAAWKHRYAPAMRAWLSAWAEFEALNALATYAFEHPADNITHTWPELLAPDHPPLYEAVALGHPLLAGSITNDICLSSPPSVPNSSRPHRDEWDDTPTLPARFFLISGSNMSGKSTLLRSIGINAVLAYAGAPVRASSLRLTPLALGASLALTDSLAEGRSKFRAEVERLAAVVRLSALSPLLFLVDEIFSGTNSADRRTAASAVLARLLANGAIGAFSTHDLVLAELVTPANGGLNVHMASPDPDDPLAFDYKLKPGVNTTSNALAIVRMMGL